MTAPLPDNALTEEATHPHCKHCAPRHPDHQDEHEFPCGLGCD